jgi:O-acetylhomoserine/O-acetylserine sulfhydrylase-like pyridoxal-dependent enzyme
MKNKTIAIHKGTLKDSRTGGVNTPVYTSSAYNYINRNDTCYPRYFNIPNQDAVAKKIDLKTSSTFFCPSAFVLLVIYFLTM